MPKTNKIANKVIHSSPHIELFSHVVSKQEVTHIQRLAQPKMKRAFVSNEQQGFVSDSRTNSVAWLEIDSDPIITSICQRIADLVDYPLEHAESLQVIYYCAEQEYQAHYDAYDLTTETGLRCTENGGQRLLTCLLYLSDVEQGGETAFPKLDLKVTPKAGFMLCFENCHPASNKRHEQSLHAALPVIKGEKWACNLWFREYSID